MTESTYYIGIDPGKTGAWAVLDDASELCSWGMLVDKIKFFDALRDLRHMSVPMLACIECSNARPGQATKATKAQGFNEGRVQGWIEAANIPFESVSSNRWQKVALDKAPPHKLKSADESPKETRTRTAANRAALKLATVEFVSRRWPVTAKDLALVKNQGIADAVCIALYCLQRNKN